MISIHSNIATQTNLHSLYASMRGERSGNAVQPESAKALATLQDSALNALAREIPGMEASDLKRLDASEYTPEKIADRISQFVAQGLDSARARGKSEEEVQALYDSAVRGVEQGFNEAKDILENLNMLGGGIGEQVQATEDATFAALEKLSPANRSQALAGSGTVGMAAAQRYQLAEDFALSLRTNEGDTVKISFSRALDAQVTLAGAWDDAGNQVSTLDVSRSERSGFQFAVEGDLSAEEIDAIQNLVRDVGQVANQFFGGDVQRAFEQASDISFDQSQLSAMSLRMSRTEQSSAAQQYRATQQLANPEQAQSGVRLGHLAQDLSDSYQRPELAFLEQAREAVSQIMQGLVEQDSRFKDAATEQQSVYRDNLNRLFDAAARLDADGAAPSGAA